ncbi:MAG: hypothetical protein ACRDRI_00170 [Pseudonocardiaceae bacterium]
MGFPLGVARRALDEFAELARTKTRGLERGCGSPMTRTCRCSSRPLRAG